MIIDDHMTAHAFDQAALIDLAVKMRDAQKRYFRTRTRSDLVAAKNLEVEFDKIIQEKGYGANA